MLFCTLITIAGCLALVCIVGLIGVPVSHIYREANHCADYLAKQGLEAYVEWVLVDNVSPMLSLLLADDARSCSLPRLVMWFFLICSFSVVYQKKIITAHYYL